MLSEFPTGAESSPEVPEPYKEGPESSQESQENLLNVELESQLPITEQEENTQEENTHN